MTAALRFTRQVRLAEVGEQGQERLAQAVVRVSGVALAAEIEARYLRGAGARVDMAGADAADEAPVWVLSLAPAAREVASGALAALRVVRAVVAGSPHARVAGGAPGSR